MNNRVRAILLKRLVERGYIANIANEKRTPLSEIRMSARKVVE